MGGCGGQMQDLALTQTQLLRQAWGYPLREGLGRHLAGWGLLRGEELSKTHGVTARERGFR